MRFLAILLCLLLGTLPTQAEFAGRPSILFGNTATAGITTGTGEQFLATYSLPANALNSVGRRLHIRAHFSLAANTNSKTLRLYFGAQVISIVTAVSAAGGATLDLWVTKSGANTQIVTGNGYSGVILMIPFSAAGTNTDTAAIVIRASGQSGTSAANNIVLQDFSVRWVN